MLRGSPCPGNRDLLIIPVRSYRYAIHLGNGSFLNIHCTRLDTVSIVIGERTWPAGEKICAAVGALVEAERFLYESDETARLKRKDAGIYILKVVPGFYRKHLAGRYYQRQCGHRREKRGNKSVRGNAIARKTHAGFSNAIRCFNNKSIRLAMYLPFDRKRKDDQHEKMVIDSLIHDAGIFPYCMQRWNNLKGGRKF